MAADGRYREAGGADISPGNPAGVRPVSEADRSFDSACRAAAFGAVAQGPGRDAASVTLTPTLTPLPPLPIGRGGFSLAVPLSRQGEGAGVRVTPLRWSGSEVPPCPPALGTPERDELPYPAAAAAVPAEKRYS